MRFKIGIMLRFLSLILAVLGLGAATPAFAAVEMHFHSFNGSIFVGRYPHTFVVLEGTLDETGKKVKENFGFSARRTTPAVLSGPVEHMLLVEKENTIRKTNRHFSVTLTDEQYHKVKAMIAEWRDAPGKFYDLRSRNCIHFVGEIAKIVGLTVQYPEDMMRRPKAWLNFVGTLNPRLGAKEI